MQPLVTWQMFLSLLHIVEKAWLNASPADAVRRGLMETIMNDPDLQGLRRWLLATKDAHASYKKFGFSVLDKPEHIMGYKPFDEYPESNS